MNPAPELYSVRYFRVCCSVLLQTTVSHINAALLKSHFLRISRIERHSPKNRFFYFAKTSLWVS